MNFNMMLLVVWLGHPRCFGFWSGIPLWKGLLLKRHPESNSKPPNHQVYHQPFLSFQKKSLRNFCHKKRTWIIFQTRSLNPGGIKLPGTSPSRRSFEPKNPRWRSQKMTLETFGNLVGFGCSRKHVEGSEWSKWTKWTMVWRIIPVSKWLVAPIHKPLSLFGRGTAPILFLTKRLPMPILPFWM